MSVRGAFRGCWDIGVLECGNVRVLADWSAGVVECSGIGVLECWSVGMLACWRIGVLECWSVGACRKSALAAAEEFVEVWI